ncbi:MAG TPA: serine hydrolase domain-containing protein [Actinomycetota bacterium]|nr:serine hydrolase domain-containing protein [Actinomycetota bacterium]
MPIDQEQLQKQLSELGEALNVPGAAAGVFIGGDEQYAYHGVTSIENPLAVDETTLFQFGSTGKTYTATAIMRLVEQGKIDLAAPVRTYVPELKLGDESVARAVTVLQLLNHTAGWDGDFFIDTGPGDDALEKYVEKMADLRQVTPLGSTVSYNNSSLSLAGRVIEKVTGSTYEQAIKDLVLDPLGMQDTFFFASEIMTRRFVAGHNQAPDGTITIARPWGMARSGTPAGGMTATAKDQIAWARFHLGDGRAADGTQVLSKRLLDQMKQPTAEMKGSALGDYVGISWLLRDVDGVRIVGHGGDTIGQHSSFLMIPERSFAIAILTNCGPNGSQLMEELIKWALEAYAGVVERDPEPLSLDASALAPYAGRYETIAAWADLSVDGEGRLVIDVELKPETRKQLLEEGAEEPKQPPIPIAILPGEGDRYIVTDGPAKGMKGYFARGANGAVEAVHVGGRLATRVKK